MIWKRKQKVHKIHFHFVLSLLNKNDDVCENHSFIYLTAKTNNVLLQPNTIAKQLQNEDSGLLTVVSGSRAWAAIVTIFIIYRDATRRSNL